MMQLIPRCLSFLLGLLLACTPTSHEETQAGKHATPLELTTSRVAPRWEVMAPMAQPRHFHTATLLQDGQLLIVGGKGGQDGSALSSAELYDPATDTWSPTGSLTEARYKHTATLLTNGKVLVVGGRSHEDGSALTSVELYDPATRTWSNEPPLSAPRPNHSAAAWRMGTRVFVTSSGSAEVYDSATRTWSAAPSPLQEYSHPLAVEVSITSFLVVGDTGSEMFTLDVPTTGKVLGNDWKYAGPNAQGRPARTATLMSAQLVLLTWGTEDGKPHSPAMIFDSSFNMWHPAKPMLYPRDAHTATRLHNGQALVVGGTHPGGYTHDTTEVFDPATGSWSAQASLRQARGNHTANVLPDGRVIVVGGDVGGTPIASVESFKPTSGTSVFTQSLEISRIQHTAILLPNGTVLVVAGQGEQGKTRATGELYDPSTERWSPTSTLPQPSRFTTGTAVLLLDGTVLLVSTEDGRSTARLYDPATGAWSPVSAPAEARTSPTLTRLQDGRVLLVGSYPGSATAELYDPATRTWSFVSPMHQARGKHTATLLKDGRVLVAGGTSTSSSLNMLSTCELYDPATRSWTLAGRLRLPRIHHTATLIPDGRVVVAGGYHALKALGDVEVYDPPTGTWSSGGLLMGSRMEHTASLMPSGKILLTGGEGIRYATPHQTYKTASIAIAELYDPATRTSYFAGTLNQQRHSHASVLLPDGRLLVVGGVGLHPHVLVPLDFSATSSAELYEATRVDSLVPLQTPSLEVPTQAQTFTTTTPVFSGTGSPGSIVNVFVDGASVGESEVADNGTWAFTTPPLAAGPHQATVVTLAPSMKELTSEHTPAVAFTVAPDTDLVLKDSPKPRTRERLARFSFSAVEGTSFECRLDEGDFTACASPLLYDALTEGAHHFQVRGRSSTGLVDPVAAEYRWTVDLTPPPPPAVLAPAPEQRVVTSALVVSGTAEAGSTVRVSVDGTSLGETVAGANGQWGLSTAELAWGDHRVTAIATDVVDNDSAPSAEVPFTTAQRGYYDLGCAASPSATQAWPLLLMLEVLRRRRSRRNTGSRKDG